MSEYCPYTYRGNPVKLRYPETFPMPSIKERNRRWTAIRQGMNKYNIDCLIVTTPNGYGPPFPYHLSYISNYVPFTNRGIYLIFFIKY